MPRPASAIVIGGGVAGASIARWLSSRGVGVTVLEKAGQLCAGATWHAAGLVTRFGGSPKIKKVHVRALELMTALHDESDGCGLHLTGSIRLIEKGDGDRLLEAKQHLAMARLYDDPALPTTMIGADEIARLHPLVDVSNIECGVFTPRDGDVDPTMLTTAIARVATAHGAQFRFNAEVRDVRVRADGRFDVAVGDDEVLSADAVVNCAGLWSRRFSRLLRDSGHPVPHHPALVIEHQYAVTESLPKLALFRFVIEQTGTASDISIISYISVGLAFINVVNTCDAVMAEYRSEISSVAPPTSDAAARPTQALALKLLIEHLVFVASISPAFRVSSFLTRE